MPEAKRPQHAKHLYISEPTHWKVKTMAAIYHMPLRAFADELLAYALVEYKKAAVAAGIEVPDVPNTSKVPTKPTVTAVAAAAATTAVTTRTQKPVPNGLPPAWMPASVAAGIHGEDDA